MPTLNFEKHKTTYEQCSGVVDYLFHLEVLENEISDYFLPNGRFEIIVDLENRVRYLHQNGEWVLRPRISIRSHHTAALRVKCDGSHYEGIGAVFSLGKIAAFIPNPLHRKYGEVIDIEDLISGCTLPLLRKLYESSDRVYKIAILDQFISQHVTEIDQQPPFVDHSLQLMSQYNGQITVKDLSLRVRCSSRHLRRSFMQHVGVSPKVLCSILRLYDTASRISRLNLPMSDVISDNGYFDRAHFYKDFIRIAGMSPSDFFNGNRHLSRHFFNTAVAPPQANPNGVSYVGNDEKIGQV